MNKKGQFYLITALIILSIVISLITLRIQNISVNKNPLEKYKEDLDFQKSQILNYLAKQNSTHAEALNVFKEFSTNYSYFLGNEKIVIFVFGNYNPSNSNNTYILYLNSLQENTNFTLELENNQTITNPGETSFNSEEDFSIYINESKQEFEMLEGENIYYLIIFNTDKENYLIRG